MSGGFPVLQKTSEELPLSHPVAVHSISGGRDAIAIATARPDYPFEARSKHITGSGTVIIDIDRKTGTVTAARMKPSTGHAILDQAAVRAFSRWRFKPGTGGKFKLPITYTMTGAR